MDVKHQIEYSIKGSSIAGWQYPEEKGFVEGQLELYGAAMRYKRLFPSIAHVMISAVFPMEGPNK